SLPLARQKHILFRPSYVILSRCTTWSNVEIFYLDRSIFNADQNVNEEY
ncbi:8975_t:CDS:1, partial [Gigaspora rosea]